VAPKPLVFVAQQVGSSDPDQLYRVWDDGFGLNQITNYTFPAVPSSSTWSPTANRIVFRRQQTTYNDDYGYDQHVGAIDIDGTDYQDLTPAGVAYAIDPVWSPDGAKIVFEDGAYTSMLKVVNADGSGLIQVAIHTTVAGQAWSPDAQRIAYYAYPDDPNTPVDEHGIWSVKADGTGRIKLRNAPGIQEFGGLQYSPDGTKMVLCHFGLGPPRLEVMNADGSGPLVYLGLGCSDPQWHPDGTRILTIHEGDLYTVSPTGQNVVQLTTNGTPSLRNHSPRWSRQGTRIAYLRPLQLRDGSDYSGLYVMFSSGSGNKRISPLGMDVHSPSWGP
jgi:Tol biopolymer transport system component